MRLLSNLLWLVYKRRIEKWNGQLNNTKFAELGYEINKYEGKTINLLILQEFYDVVKRNPNEILVNIFGKEKEAKDCNDDDRQGHVAWARIDWKTLKSYPSIYLVGGLLCYFKFILKGEDNETTYSRRTIWFWEEIH